MTELDQKWNKFGKRARQTQNVKVKKKKENIHLISKKREQKEK